VPLGEKILTKGEPSNIAGVCETPQPAYLRAFFFKKNFSLDYGRIEVRPLNSTIILKGVIYAYFNTQTAYFG